MRPTIRCLIIITKESSGFGSALVIQKLSQWACEEEAETDPEEICFEFDETLETTVIRVTTYTAATVQMTPLILPVVEVLLEDIKRHVSTLPRLA